MTVGHHRARSLCRCKAVLLVHTDQDAEHHGHDDNRRGHNANSVITSTTSHEKPLSVSTTIAATRGVRRRSRSLPHPPLLPFSLRTDPGGGVRERVEEVGLARALSTSSTHSSATCLSSSRPSCGTTGSSTSSKPTLRVPLDPPPAVAAPETEPAASHGEVASVPVGRGAPRGPLLSGSRRLAP